MYNYRTGKYEVVNGTIEDYSDYVPQQGGLGMYKIYVEHYGMKPEDAAIRVLQIAAAKLKKD